MSELPKGWVTTYLETLVASTKYPIGDGDHGQIKPACYTNKGIPYIRVADMGWGKFVPNGMVYIPETVHKQNLKSELSPGDILIAKTGATIGKCCIIPDNIPKANTTASVGKVTINREVTLPKWILYYFLSREFKEQMWAVSEKTAQPGFNNRDLKRFVVPLAPLDEQRRIVAKLERLLHKVDACKERLNKIPAILKRFRQSVLSAACSGRLTADWREKNQDFEPVDDFLRKIYEKRKKDYNDECTNAILQGKRRPPTPSNLQPKIRVPENDYDISGSWFWTSIEDIASCKRYAMSSGPFGSALGTKDYKENGVPVIRGQNIQNGKFILDSFVYVSNEKASALERSAAYPRDIVVVAVGSSGQAAMVPKELPKAILSQNCNKITLDSSMALSDFIIYHLQNEIAKSQIRDKTTDTARPFLSLSNLKQTLLPIPPLAEQHEIVRRVEALFKKADEIEVRYKKAKAFVDKLTQSILAKAFRGELVPQDPNDEPASVLLERIREANTINLQKKRKKSKLEKEKR